MCYLLLRHIREPKNWFKKSPALKTIVFVAARHIRNEELFLKFVITHSHTDVQLLDVSAFFITAIACILAPTSQLGILILTNLRTAGDGQIPNDDVNISSYLCICT